MSSLSYNELLAILAHEFDGLGNKRSFIALAGPPASGKSTISEKLKSDFNTKGFASDILQMDGFHFDDSILISKDLLPRKGSPETFDVQGLKNYLSRLQNEGEVVVPIFDRSLEVSRSSAHVITQETQIIIVEGNYLLLNSEPWSELKKYFDFTVMLDCEEKVLEKRLIKRWESFKLSKDDINKKVYDNDLPNGIKVIQNSNKADFNLFN